MKYEERLSSTDLYKKIDSEYGTIGIDALYQNLEDLRLNKIQTPVIKEKIFYIKERLRHLVISS